MFHWNYAATCKKCLFEKIIFSCRREFLLYSSYLSYAKFFLLSHEGTACFWLLCMLFVQLLNHHNETTFLLYSDYSDPKCLISKENMNRIFSLSEKCLLYFTTTNDSAFENIICLCTSMTSLFCSISNCKSSLDQTIHIPLLVKW